jgi:hypothetical protein
VSGGRSRWFRRSPRPGSHGRDLIRSQERRSASLAHRVDGGLDVTLLWSAGENRVAVTVFDQRAGELLVFDVEGDEALDVFYHPYAHGASQAAA